jgi:glycosyltransferase involved in cell wall biosynthesis
MTRFAVIVTSYNYRDFVVEAVDSVLAQARAPAQVIVVDDGSTDGSPDVLRDHYAADPRVTLLCGGNGGQLAAFRRGLAAVDDAATDVVCFLDSDDRWHPDYLGKVGTLYDERHDVDFVFSDLNVFGDEQRRIAYAGRATDLGYTAISTYVSTCWYGAPTSALSMRNDWARRSVDLPEDMVGAWRLSADNCLVYGASVLGARKYFLPTGSVDYRIHGKNGWWPNRGPVQSYQNRMRSRALVARYALMAGIDDSCIDLAKLEYRTKPDPAWNETRRYAEISLRGDAPWWKRGERAIAIFADRARGH